MPAPQPAAYTLNTSFDQDSLDLLYSTGTNVVVAKPTAGAEPTVAWVVYRPFETNVMTWVEEYGIYASNISPVNGAILTQMSNTEFPALEDKTYQFTPAGHFGGPSSGPGQPGSYYALNSYTNANQYLTIGLYQNAVVNGEQVSGNAISAAPVIIGSTAQMTPYTTVYLWLQSQVLSNSVVTVVTSPKTKVTFGGGHTNISLTYKGGVFLPSSRSALAEGLAVDHHVASLL